MDTLFNSLGVTIIYLALLGIGIIYAVIILLGAELQDLHIPGLDLHDLGIGHVDTDVGAVGGVDHAVITVPTLSPITIASFVTAFGAFGLIALELFDTSARGSLGWAAIGGLMVAVIAHFAFGYFLIAPQGSSEVKMADMVGTTAEVITPIPADSVGEVAFVAQGGRVTYTARSASSAPIARGTTVVIEKVVGGAVIVRPQD